MIDVSRYSNHGYQNKSCVCQDNKASATSESGYQADISGRREINQSELKLTPHTLLSGQTEQLLISPTAAAPPF